MLCQKHQMLKIVAPIGYLAVREEAPQVEVLVVGTMGIVEIIQIKMPVLLQRIAIGNLDLRVIAITIVVEVAAAVGARLRAAHQTNTGTVAHARAPKQHALKQVVLGQALATIAKCQILSPVHQINTGMEVLV
jgi:hypothetical protein